MVAMLRKDKIRFVEDICIKGVFCLTLDKNPTTNQRGNSETTGF
jgi:hypothetical protein